MLFGNQMPNPRGMPPMFRGPNMGAGPFGRGAVRPSQFGPNAGGGNMLTRLFQRQGAGGPPQFGSNARGGNMLANLFQRQGAGSMASQGSQAANMFSRGGGQTSFLQGLTNPQTINGFLSNTQNVLNTARQIGPLVQQYGPMIRNLPAMWRLYKGFKDLPSGDSEDAKTNAEETKTESVKTKNEAAKKITVNASTAGDEQKKSVNRSVTNRKKGESVPKLYIP